MRPELGEDDELGGLGPGLLEHLVMARQVLVERAEPRRELGQGDPGGSRVGHAPESTRPGSPTPG